MKNRGLIVVLFVFACLGWAAHTKYQKEDEGTLRTNTSTILSALDLPIEELRRKTAVLSLEEGGKSLAARLWLLENAKHTIKIQYYSFARNISGLITCQYMLKVADRGVKIRLLVDEASSRMNEYEIKSLDAHENIEIKVFNAGLKIGRVDKRMKKLIENRNRLLYRMHNKTFVIDGQVAITGGRNISDEYFDIDEKYNFRDRDVVLFGKAAGSAEGSFDMFWEHNLSVPVASLTAKKKEYDPRKIFDKMNRVFNDTGSFAPVIRKYVADFPKAVQEARRADRCLILENVSFVSDVPTKNEDRPEQKGGVSTDTIVALIRSATKTVDIQSPYFITLDEGKQLLRETLQRGVRVRILTNSLASIDNVEALTGINATEKNMSLQG